KGNAIPALPTAALHRTQPARASAVPRSIIADEHHQRAFVESKFLQRREHFADARIQVGHDIAIQAGADLLVELLGRSEWLVRHRMGEVEEERFRRIPSQEINGARRVTPGQRGLHHGILDDLLTVEKLDRPHVIAVKKTEIAVETATRRK